MNRQDELAPVAATGRRWRSDAWRLAVIGCAYVVAHKLAYLFPGAGGVIAAIWPASGIALAAMLLNPTRLWPAVLAVCAGANLTVELLAGRALVVEAGFILANLLESGLGAWVICRWSGRPVSFNRATEILALLVAALAVNGLSAAVGGAAASYASGQAFWKCYGTWWVGDGLGMLLVTPLIVAWFRPTTNALPTVNLWRVMEGVAVMTLSLGLAWAYFGTEREAYAVRPHSYMLFVPLVWAALRLGVRGVTTALALLAVGELAITAAGVGGFPLGGRTATEQVQWVQLFLAVQAVTALLLAASVAERAASEASLRTREASLRALGDNLPQGMVYQVLREADGTMRFIYLSSSVERLNGRPAAEVLRNSALLYDQVLAEDRHVITAAEAESLRTMSVFNVVVRMRRADGAIRWMHINSQPRSLPDGRVLWDGIETDITEQKAAEEKLLHLNRALRTISNCNQVLVRARTEAELLDKICAIVVQDGGYRMAWVGFAENDPARTVRAAAQAGESAEHLVRMHVTWAEDEFGSGPTGTAIRTGRPSVRQDVAEDPASQPWRDVAERFGIRASVGLPLLIQNRTLGALTIYSTQQHAFDDAELRLLTELADDLAFGIQALRDRHTRDDAEAQVRQLLAEAEAARATLERLLAQQRQADEALRVSEAQLRSATEHSPIGMALAAPDGRWLEVNPALCQIVGYSREALLAMDYQKLTPPEDLDLDREHLRRLFAREIETYQVEKRYLHQRGHAVWIQLNVSLVWNADGSPRHFVTQVQDVTARRRAEDERVRLVRDLGERVKELTALQRAARLLQQERPLDRNLLADVVALLPPAMLYPEICAARIVCGELEACTPRWTDVPEKLAVSFASSSGLQGVLELVYLEARPAAAEGPFLAEERLLVQSLADMVAAYLERKQAQKALLDSRARLVLAMEIARLGHWEYDVATERFEFDDDLYRLYATTAAREGGTLMSTADYARKFLPPEERGVVAEEIRRAIATTNPEYARQLEHRFVRADGSTGVLLVRFAIGKDAQGRTVKLYGANQDVTEQRRAEEKQRELEGHLRQAQKLEALGTLAGGIAHDFNNILAAMISYTELARMENPGNAELQENLRQVLKAGERATGLVRQILSFSRRQKQERKLLQLAPVVQEALKLLRSTLPATIEIQSELSALLPDVFADPGQIHQVLMNLCTNAGHAMRGRQGRLRVALDLWPLPPGRPRPHAELREGEYVRLVVSDTGHGMDDDTLKRVFEPFFTTKAPGEGTGLGLSVVHGIVKEHDGVITVTSEPGRGATFTIYLPARPAGVAGAELSVGEVPRGNNERVLFVDDESALCSVAQKVLTRLGYQAAVFTKPEAAWRALEAEPAAWDVLVTDLTMPGMTGLDLSRLVVAVRPDLPIILTSGFSGTLTLDAVRELGVRELIQKPLDYRTLGQALRRVLHPA